MNVRQKFYCLYINYVKIRDFSFFPSWTQNVNRMYRVIQKTFTERKNVHKMLRKLSGLLLNVLCTFNLSGV